MRTVGTKPPLDTWSTDNWSCATERTEGEAVMASLTRDSLIAIARELELIQATDSYRSKYLAAGGKVMMALRTKLHLYRSEIPRANLG